MKLLSLILIPLFICSGNLDALEPKDVLLIVNPKMPGSKEIAQYYCKARGVPEGNVLSLELPTKEDISQADYQKLIVKPLRAALKARKEPIKVLLTVYGVPLRVGAISPSEEERKQAQKLRETRNPVRAERDRQKTEVERLEKLNKEAPSKETAEGLKKARAKLNELNGKVRGYDSQIKRLSHTESRAAVDSELSLLWYDNYPLDRWQYNPLFWQNKARVSKDKPFLMVARLDGPNPDLIKRLIDQSIAVEKKGLQGKVYVDARGIGYTPGKTSTMGYGGYDQALRDMAGLLKGDAKMDVVLDNKSALFTPQSCPDCALYCGWYSHARFVDCCKFAPGAVAYHIASSEAVSLRRPNVKFWCKNLLEKGAVATLGPVAEPYTIEFPSPRSSLVFW